MKYSDSLKPYVGDVKDNISEFINEVKNYYNLANVTLLKFDEHKVAISVEINVNLPPLGAVNIDIREKEPIMIVASLNYYPFISPSIYSDRKDFPKQSLAHLYVSEKDDPACLCLVRNSKNEWFASHRLYDLLSVVNDWYYKAGSGILSDDGDEFDPIRLENYSGYQIYRYNKCFDIIKNNEATIPGQNFAVLFGSMSSDEDDKLYVKSYNNVPLLAIQKLLELLPKIEKEKLLENPVFSLLIWADNLNANYDVELPKTYEQLLDFTKKHLIDIESPLKFYFDNNLHKVNGIPIICAIKRPRKMVGYDGDYEFFNFLISGKETKKGKIPKLAKVRTQSHIEPFSSELAEKISGKICQSNLLFIGAGSLGSKIIMHQVRNGSKNIKVYDSDKFLKHNLCRHILHSNKVGQNKATAIIKEAKDYFETDQTTGLEGFDKDISLLTTAELQNVELIVDTTASLNVQNWLCSSTQLTKHCIIRTEIANKGALGLLYREGSERNPRIDDLVNYTYYLSTKDKALADWRKYDSETEHENLSIGLGCSSTTSIISDDEISFHAAQFSKFVQYESTIKSKDTDGAIFLSKSSVEYPFVNENTFFKVPKFKIYPCAYGSKWELRILDGISEKIFSDTKKAGSMETGGVLLGIANYKTKTIHVLDLIDAPSDSRKESCCFYRGINNLPESVEKLRKTTGNMIGYIGEWHSHPMGLDTLSAQDLYNVEKLKVLNNRVPIPTCSMIVSNEKILPFVFE